MQSEKNRKKKFIKKSLISVLVVTPALALGAVHTPLLTLYLAVAAGLYVTFLTGRQSRPPHLDLVSYLFLGLIVFTILQLLPIPSVIVKYLAPSIYDVRVRAMAPLQMEAPAFMPLTLDVTLTAQEVVKLLIYLAVYWGVLSWTRANGPRDVVNMVMFAGVVAALVLLAHRIFLMDKVYGFYVPMHVRSQRGTLSAPLLNANHLAGLLGLCAAVSIGKALVILDRTRRAVYLGIAAVIGGSLMLTLSRGGIAAFLAGQVLFVIFRVVSRLGKRGKRPRVAHWSWLPVGVALSLGLGFFAAQDAIVGEFLGGDVKKLELALEGLPLIGRFWTTGVGRGAFWVGFPLVSDLTVRTTFTHAENAVVQILADYGLVFGGAVLTVSCIVLGRLLRNVSHRADLAAALAAIVAFGIHNLVDFNMEIPGVAVLVVALLGILSGGRSGHSEGLKRAPKTVIILLAAMSVAFAVAMVIYIGPFSVDREQTAYKAAWKRGDAAFFEKKRLAEVLSRHPADWYIPLLAGAREYQVGHENPLPLLARAIELNRSSATAHFYVGATLLRLGHRDQAMLEMRLAARYNPTLDKKIARTLVARVPQFNKISKIAVTKNDKVLLWSAFAHAFALRNLDKEAEAADTAVLNIDPRNPSSLVRHVRRRLARGEFDGTLALAKILAEVPDYGPSGIQLQAEVLQAKDNYDGARRVLEGGLRTYKNHPALLKKLAWNLQKAGDHNGALKAAGELKALSADTKGRSAAALLEARLSLTEGRLQVALAHFREAYALDPSNIGILEQVANVAERQGDQSRVLDALRELARARPENAAIKKRLEQFEEIHLKKKNLSNR